MTQANHWPTLSWPLADAKLRVVSYGGGVQSTTMLLMAMHGEITPMPDVAIFADTDDEPLSTWETVNWISSANVGLPFPINVVSAGSIRDQMLSGQKVKGRPPLFVEQDGRTGMTKRQCTGDWKLIPIEREVRHLIGLRPRQRWPLYPVVEQWIGISKDEIGRCSSSGRTAVHNRHPLIELNMTRRDCERWLLAHDYPVPKKSRCRICPYQSDALWRELRDEAPDDFAAAVEVDRSMRLGGFDQRAPGRILLKGTPYLHRSLKPLDEVDFDAPTGPPTFDFDGCGGGCGL